MGPLPQYLNTWLGQVDLQSDLLPHEDVRVARLGEQGLQDVELGASESGALPTLFPGSSYTNTNTRLLRYYNKNYNFYWDDVWDEAVLFPPERAALATRKQLISQHNSHKYMAC